MTDRSILGDIGSRSTPQSEPIPGRTDMVTNDAGGVVFGLDDWGRLDRFLILGVDQGTYYVGARELAIDNAKMVDRCLDTDYTRTIDTAVDVSVAGRAPSNDPALFVIACGASHPDADVRRYALSKLREVARIGTHLFHFVRFAQSRRGWGRTLARAVSGWYTAREADSLAYDVVKYRQRDGWSHRDVLRKAHPKGTGDLQAVLRFAAGQPVDPEHVGERPRIIEGFLKMQEATDAPEAAELVREYRLPWETVPSDFLNGGDVWRALLDVEALPLGATLRNLGRLTERGVIKQGSDSYTADIVKRLADEDTLRKARIHPVGILNALVTYRSGHGLRGGLTWTPVSSVVNALDEAFYKAFGNVEPTGKRIMLALDVSGSMGMFVCNGSAFNAREGSAAMSMVTAAVEKDVTVVGFSHTLIPLDISPRRRLDDNIRAISGIPFGATDASLPAQWAKQTKAEVDTIIVYTDNETWSGRDMHPTQALEAYRQASGIDTKQVVVGMTSTGFTIADPKDVRQLDVVGFDTQVPNVISGFAAG